jgi:hypothetical protein
MKSNNGTNRVLYHDIAAQTIREPPPCFNYWRKAIRIAGILGFSPNVYSSSCNSVKDDSSGHMTRAFPVV